MKKKKRNKILFKKIPLTPSTISSVLGFVLPPVSPRPRLLTPVHLGRPCSTRGGRTVLQSVHLVHRADDARREPHRADDARREPLLHHVLPDAAQQVVVVQAAVLAAHGHDVLDVTPAVRAEGVLVHVVLGVFVAVVEAEQVVATVPRALFVVLGATFAAAAVVGSLGWYCNQPCAKTNVIYNQKVTKIKFILFEAM